MFATSANKLHTSQKNSFPRRPQNQEIHETSSELLIPSYFSEKNNFLML